MDTNDNLFIIDMIAHFNDIYPHVSFLANLVMNNQNVSDSNIDFAIQYLHENRDDYIKRHLQGTKISRSQFSMDIDRLAEFLVFLRKIPEDIRYEYGTYPDNE